LAATTHSALLWTAPLLTTGGLVGIDLRVGVLAGMVVAVAFGLGGT
jgi:hypothetical protein